MLKNPCANEGDIREVGGLIPREDLQEHPSREDSPRGGHDNPHQYSCLEKPMDRGAWWATIHRVTKSQT